MANQPTILALGADGEFLSELDGILSRSDMRRILVHSLPVALARAKRARRVDAVIADCEPESGTWKCVLTDLCEPRGIPLIVTSRQADDALWSEVLYYGGFDVLARPLRSEEVERVIASAIRSIAKPREQTKLLAMHA